MSSLGTVVTVHTHLGLAVNRMTMLVFMDQLVQATRAKIQDVRSDCPGKPIILVGFNTGSALACQVILFKFYAILVGSSSSYEECGSATATNTSKCFSFLFCFLDSNEGKERSEKTFQRSCGAYWAVS